jgi:hypothetical protein
MLGGNNIKKSGSMTLPNNFPFPTGNTPNNQGRKLILIILGNVFQGNLSNNSSNTKSNISQNNIMPNMNIKNKENSNLENHLFNLLNNKKIKSVVQGNTSQENVVNSIPSNSNKVNQMSHNFSNHSNNTNNLNTTTANASNFINSYTSFNKRDSLTSENNNNSVKAPLSQLELNEDEMQKLTERHEKLINKILIEEESYIENHRKHVDEMVEIMKEVTFKIFNITSFMISTIK